MSINRGDTLWRTRSVVGSRLKRGAPVLELEDISSGRPRFWRARRSGGSRIHPAARDLQFRLPRQNRRRNNEAWPPHQQEF